MDEELRKAADDAADWLLSNTCFKSNPKARAIHEALDKALAKNANAAPQDATDWEGVSADQAMTIAMLRVDYQQLSDLCTRQGIRSMEQEEWQKEAARYRFIRTMEAPSEPDEFDRVTDLAMKMGYRP